MTADNGSISNKTHSDLELGMFTGMPFHLNDFMFALLRIRPARRADCVSIVLEGPFSIFNKIQKITRTLPVQGKT